MAGDAESYEINLWRIDVSARMGMHAWRLAIAVVMEVGHRLLGCPVGSGPRLPLVHFLQE